MTSNMISPRDSAAAKHGVLHHHNALLPNYADQPTPYQRADQQKSVRVGEVLLSYLTATVPAKDEINMHLESRTAGASGAPPDLEPRRDTDV